MSGFFGIFRPQGGSVDLEAFEQMRKATEREGFDGLETHVEEKIAMGHLMLRVSPESKYDKQPLKSDCGNYLLVGHFRLDYRDELGDKLGLTQSELEITPDSKLVMLAYIKWLEKCVHHIEGDWAFALFDKSINSFILAKDRTGFSALFYTHYQDDIYFSSDVNVIGSIDTIPFEVDIVQLYRISLPSILIEKGKTLLKGVYHLNGGTYIYANNKSKTQTHQYWEKLDSKSVLYDNDQDYAEHLQSVLAQSIRSRLRTEEKTGIFLSAGLDSMAVAFFSSSEFNFSQNKLYSFTSHPYYLDKIDKNYHKVINEVPLVQKFVAKFENVDATYLNFPNIQMKDLFDSDLTKDLYNPIISTNTFWIQGILESAKSKKIMRMLNGQIGNMTISFNAPFIQADRFFNFQINKLIKEFKILVKVKSQNYFYIFKNYFFFPIYLVVKSFYNNKMLFGKNHLSKSMLFNYNILKEKRIHYELSANEFVPDYYFFKSSRKLQIDQLNRYVDFSGMNWYKDMHKFGMEGVDPTSDARLIDFILSIPIDQFNKRSQQKLIYQNMMAGKLPQEILFNPFSMRQSFDICLRISNDHTFQVLFMFLEKNVNNTNIKAAQHLKKMFNEIICAPNLVIKQKEILFLFRNISLLYCVLKNNKFKFELK